MTAQHFSCPCCGQDITRYVDAVFRDQRSAAGRTKTKKKSASGAENMKKINASYTPGKRKAAAEKRRKTMEAKREKSNGL